MLSDVITINIDRDSLVKPYVTKFLLGFNQDNFLKRLLELGEDWLEENKVFAVLFDNTPPDQIESMKNYSEVLKYFPKSNRVVNKGVYIGNIKGDPYQIALSILGLNAHPHDFEIVEVVN